MSRPTSVGSCDRSVMAYDVSYTAPSAPSAKRAHHRILLICWSGEKTITAVIRCQL